MGAGKTTLGRELAGRLGREFLDLDRAIEERAGKTIAELFDERGEAEFRRIEAHAARVALAAPEPLVLSLGGGAPTSPETPECAREGLRRADRHRRRVGLGAGEAVEAAARTRRGGVPAALRRARAALPRARGRGLHRHGRNRARGGGRPLRARRPRPARRARPRRRAGRARLRQHRDGHLRRAGAGGARLAARELARAAGGRGGEVGRRALADLARAPARPHGHGRRARRRLHDRPRRVRRRDLPARRSLGGGADDARRPGRRGNRRQDRDRHPRGQEPRRCVPLAGAGRARRDAARDAARARAAAGDGRAREDAAARGAEARRPRRGVLQGGDLPPGSARPRAAALAQPGPHLRPRAGGRGRLRPAARGGGRARAARGAADLGPRHRGGRARARTRSRLTSTRSGRGRRSSATRSGPAMRSTSCCSETTARTSRRGRPTRCGASSSG